MPDQINRQSDFADLALATAEGYAQCYSNVIAIREWQENYNLRVEEFNANK